MNTTSTGNPAASSTDESALAAKTVPLSLKISDLLLLVIMMLLAGCGLIYEYLLSHYAGRILGSMESAIFAMIGIMIVAMGVGAFAARKINDAFTGFVWLEILIALIGSSAIVGIAAIIAFTHYLPHIIADVFALPNDALPHGGAFKTLTELAQAIPFVVGFFLGFLIGMEIPIIARIRESLYARHLQHNIGTVYGADYIGAGIGAAIWVIVMLHQDISISAASTAAVNLVAGLVFMAWFWSNIRNKIVLVGAHALLAIVVVAIYLYGTNWTRELTNLLYLDKVVYQQQTRHQHMLFTERLMQADQPSVINFYLNGRLQFSSNDEHIYHNMLVYPALAGSAKQERVLIIGGGDGLALRDVLRWQPKQVVLIDMDSQLTELFADPSAHLPGRLARIIQSLGANALNDPRVSLIHDDAFVAIDTLLTESQQFDSIIVDLPDPSHPDLNRLYSVNFYARLKLLLSNDGLISIQSTSPYHAKNAFISIAKTVAAAGYSDVEQYHSNVPSFGEWGWTIASKAGLSPLQRLQSLEQLPVDNEWITLDLITASFAFPKSFYSKRDEVKVNYLGSNVLYQYHLQAWQSQQGLNQSTIQP